MLWVGVLRPDLWLRLSADHVAALGEVRALTLEDGSRVLLDGGSAIDTDLSGEVRRVVLREGSAYFDVRPDGRSFVVQLGTTEVRVLGTRFGLQLVGEGSIVTLESGSVEVSGNGVAPVTLTPGQQLRQEAGRPPDLREVSAEEALGWREGRVTFYDVPLAEVTDKLARSGVGPILLARPGLGARRVSGSLRLEEPERDLARLAAGLGLDIVRLPGLTLLR